MNSATVDRLDKILTQGLLALDLTLDQGQQAQLLAYLGLLLKWNAVYNLTAVRAPEKMMVQHVLDSLAVVKYFESAGSILDVGSGGGLPGLVLAIAQPEKTVVLIDTVQKKTAFLKQVCAELRLLNVKVQSARVEEWQTPQRFDVITARAFADLRELVRLSHPLLATQGKFIAMKGAIPDAEIAELPEDWKVTAIEPIRVPGMDAQRHIIVIERKSS